MSTTTSSTPSLTSAGGSRLASHLSSAGSAGARRWQGHAADHSALNRLGPCDWRPPPSPAPPGIGPWLPCQDLGEVRICNVTLLSLKHISFHFKHDLFAFCQIQSRKTHISQHLLGMNSKTAPVRSPTHVPMPVPVPVNQLWNTR